MHFYQDMAYWLQMILFRQVAFEWLIGHHKLSDEEIEEQVLATEKSVKQIDDSTYDLLEGMFESLSKKPYASLSIVLFYRYFHFFDITVKSREIELTKMGDNIYNLITSPDKLFPIAKEFDYLNGH